MNIIIRKETLEDRAQIREVHIHAFGNRMDEAELVDRIRESSGFIPELSLVAENEIGIVGHLLISKAEVVSKAGRHPVIVVAPLAVSPAYQKQGIGSQLMLQGLEISRALGYTLVFLIGHPHYYPKFGFKPARSFGYDLKQFNVPDEVFMVCELQEGAASLMDGELKYPPTVFPDMTFTIRQATKEDELFLWDMLFESLYTPEGQEPFSREILQEPFMAKYVEGWGRPGDIGYIAVNSNGEAVGSITARLFNEDNKGFGFVADDVPELGMAIRSEYRGHGLGKALMSALFNGLKEFGVQKVSLSVDPDNTPAVRLYERFGFVQTGVVGTSITMVAPV